MALDPEALRRAVDDLLDALDADHLEELVRNHDDRARLHRAIADRARAVADAVARKGRPVQPEEYPRLVAAMLSSRGTGVHHNTRHATAAFERFRAYPNISPETLVKAARLRPECLPLLDATQLLLRELRSCHPDADPARFAIAVASTVLAVTGKDPAGALADVIQVLGRATTFVHAYYDSGRPLPADPALAGEMVLGNADFLLTAAAMRLALLERFGMAPDDVVGAIEDDVRTLAPRLRSALARRVRPRGVHSHGEPDAMRIFPQVVAYLSKGFPSARDPSAEIVEDVRVVYSVLTPWSGLMLREVTDRVVDLQDDGGGKPEPTPLIDAGVALQPYEVMAERDRALGWFLAALFEKTEPGDHDTLADWVIGRRPVDTQDDLRRLFRQSRTVVETMRSLPEVPAPSPSGLRSELYRRLDAHIRAVAEANGMELVEPVALAAELLPELWSHRRFAVSLLAEHLAVELGGHHAAIALGTAVAAVLVRSPVQRFLSSQAVAPEHACERVSLMAIRPCTSWGDGSPPRRIGVEMEQVCRDRPWHETGNVESYQTVADVSRYPSTDAVRQALNRYEGPDADLLREALAGR